MTMPIDEEIRRPLRWRLLRIAWAILWVTLALATSGAVVAMSLHMHLKRTYVPGGPAPRGYETLNQLYAAYLLRSFRLIDREPPLPSGVRLESGVSYARAAGQELKLDLYLPGGIAKDKPRALFVLIHGGGWKSGQREDYRPHAVRVAAAGYPVASLSYRLSGTAKFPAQIRDVNAALQFLADQGAKYGIDPQRIVVMGGSAGGHLAMLAAYADMPEFAPEADPNLQILRPADTKKTAYEIAAVFNFYGPSDLTTSFAVSQSVVPALMGGTFEQMSDTYRAASPMSHLSPDDPPTLLVHGTLDDIVPVQQSDKLAEGLFWVRVPVRYERLFGWPHTMDLSEPVFEYLSRVILEELRDAVGPPEGAASE